MIPFTQKKISNEGHLVFHCIPSFGGGGAERQLCYLANCATRTKTAIHIAYIHDGPNLNVLDRSNSTLHRIRAAGNYDPSILLQLVRLIRNLRPRLVQTWTTQMDVMGGMASLMTGTPFIVTERSSTLAYSGNWKNRLRTIICKRAIAVIANSESGRRYWRMIGYKGPIYVIRNGVPIDKVERVQPIGKAELSIPEGKRIILFAGRFSEEKNVVLLLQALLRVVAERKNVSVFLFGEGPLRSRLERQIHESGLGLQFHLAGFTNSLWAVMKVADIFISISTFEGNPNTVLEAMAARCPLVVSDIPEHREFLDESSAYFVNPLSVDAIASTIVHVLDNPAESRYKAKTAFGVITEWSIESRTKEYMELYHEIITAH